MLLANEQLLRDWLESRKHSVEIRSQQLANLSFHAAQSGEMSGDSLSVCSPVSSAWWQEISQKAEGSDYDRIGTAALVDVQGALQHHYSIWSWLTDSSCYKGIISKVKAAASDDSIDRIVLNIHSPGGQHIGCPEAAQAVYEAREAKPVIAVVEFEAASAAYYIASQASQVVGLESGWVGSIGSQCILASMYRYYQEAGIDIEVIRSKVSPKKNLGHPYEEISDAARAQRQRWADEAGQQFVAAVARGRGVSEDTVRNTFGGGDMMFMPAALSAGMVDGYGTLSEILANRSASSAPTRGQSRRSNAETDRTLDAVLQRYSL